MTLYKFKDREDWEGPDGCRMFALGLDARSRRWTPDQLVFMNPDEAARLNSELERQGRQERWERPDSDSWLSDDD